MGVKTFKKCSKCKENKNISEFHSGKYYCKKCVSNISLEWARNNKDRVKEIQEKWREANREREKIRSKIYREANKEYYRKKSKEYYWNNKDARNKQNREWCKNNPEKCCEKVSRRNAAKLNATPEWANQKYINLWYKFARTESKRTNKKVVVDHIVPLQSDLVCGLHCEDNMQLLFDSDNASKSNRYWPNMWDMP